MKNVLLSVLMIAAFALLSPVVSSAQTTATAADGSTMTVASKPAPAATDSTAVTSVGLGSGVTSITSDSNGNVYASLQYTNKVVKLNGSGTVIGTFAVGRNPTGLLVDNAASVLYVLNNADNTVSKLGLDGTLVATFKVAGDGPVFAAQYGSTLYLACERSNTLVRMSTDGVALGSTDVGARPVWVAISVTSSKGTMMTTDASATPATTDPGMTTATMDPGTTTTTDSTASRPTASTVNVYVSCNKANQVWKLSSAGAVVAKFDSARGPYGIVVNGSGQVLVACFWDAVVLRLDGSTGGILSKTAVGDGAAGMVSYGNVVAVISNGSNSISRLSVADGTFISGDKVDRSPLIGAATPSALWISCTGSGTIARRAL
jgi:hypothetical protein